MTLRLRCLHEAPGWVVVLLAAILYAWLVPQAVLGGDNGEFALLAHVDGIAHAPGYPLYVALLRLLRWWPAGSAAQAAGQATVLMASAQLLVTYAAGRLWGVPAWASGLALSLYAGSSLCIQHFTHAEVFALNGLIVALILCLVAPQPWLRPWFRLPLLSLVCGLGLAHHHSFVLVMPLIVFGVLQSVRSQQQARVPLLTVSLLAFAVGFLPNLLLLVWSQSPKSYLYSPGGINGWYGFWHHFLRRDYGSFNLAASDPLSRVDVVAHFNLLLRALVEGWNALIVMAVLAFAARLRRLGSVDWWAWLALFCSVLLAGPIFLLRANIDPAAGIANWEVLERFYLLPLQLLLIPVGEGLRLCGLWIRAAGPWRSGPSGAMTRWQRGLVEPLLAPLLAVSLLGLQAASAVRSTEVRRAPVVETYLRGLLDGLPADAVVLARGDEELYGGSYLQHVEGVRPDVVLLDPTFLAKPWFVQRLARRLPGCRWSATTQEQLFIDLLESCRRPLLVSDTVAGLPSVQALMAHRASVQDGSLRRILRREDPVPAPDQVLQRNHQLFEQLVMPESPLSLAHGWASLPMMRYRFAWQRIADDLRRAGRPDLAREALRWTERFGACVEEPCR